MARYQTQRDFVTPWDKAVDRSVEAGYLVPVDARELKRAAARSQIIE